MESLKLAKLGLRAGLILGVGLMIVLGMFFCAWRFHCRERIYSLAFRQTLRVPGRLGQAKSQMGRSRYLACCLVRLVCRPVLSLLSTIGSRRKRNGRSAARFSRRGISQKIRSRE